MPKIFLLSKQNIELSKQEVLALTQKQDFMLIDDLLIINTDFKDYKRLAYTKEVYDLLFISNPKNLLTDIKNFNWQKIYKTNFCLRAHNNSKKEKDLAGYIWNKLKNPKVNLKNPKTEIHFFFIKNKVIGALSKHKNKQEFEKRKPHLRPELHPSSLNPRLARALINLTGIEKGTLLDPFCGSGGILIEAGLINLIPIGYDTDKIMLKRAEINLKHYKIKNYKLKQQDATKIKTKFNYIVTDLPYSKNTKKQDLIKLYSNFLKTLKKILKKKAVIGFPDFIDYKNLIKKSKLKIEKEFNYYLHKNLTKKIILLSL
ncbi:methyltransferase domain-containing protein [Candidatus Woesearchaeota archaeon]|nr:methyltransferase domain-containing protein [Candidatus Woesearchaeota archaeon]